MAGDILLRVDDLKLDQFAQTNEEISALVNSVVDYVAGRSGQTLSVAVQRGLGAEANQLTLEVTPRPDDEGNGKMGVIISATAVRMERVQASVLDALQYGISEIWFTIRMTVSIPLQVLRGLIPASSARSVGPVGIAQLTGDAVQQSIDTGWAFPILQLTGVLNVAIAFTNLLPLPALDGGRIFFILLEALRGKPVPPEKEGLVHSIGMVLLLLVLVVITIQDIFVPLPQSFNWTDYLY
jgi:regulator of sigma E protease